MANYQLIDFINQNLRKGLTENNIKQLLLNDGWSAEQINDGFRLIEFIQQNLKDGFEEKQIIQSLLENDWTQEQVDAGFRFVNEHSPISPKKSSAKILIFVGVLFFLIVLSLTAYFLFIYLKSNSEISNETQTENIIEAPSTLITSDPITTIEPSTETLTDLDLTKFSAFFEIIKTTITEKNKEAYIQNSTKKTNEMILGGFEPVWYSDMKLVKTEIKGISIIATMQVTHENGSIEEIESLFIKEDGLWKLAIAENIERKNSSLTN